MPLLSCRGLTRRPWFEGRDLDVERGEIVVLSGATGSGKTLFLRSVADLDPCDGGEVSLDGVERGTMSGPQWRSRVLYVHQSGVRLRGTVADNVARVAGDGADGVPGLSPDADAERLSGGEAQMMALHRALACDPDVLLLDESTSALDRDTADRWEARVREWVGEGHAALWVAHDGELAGRLGARAERFP